MNYTPLSSHSLYAIHFIALRYRGQKEKIFSSEYWINRILFPFFLFSVFHCEEIKYKSDIPLVPSMAVFGS